MPDEPSKEAWSIADNIPFPPTCGDVTAWRRGVAHIIDERMGTHPCASEVHAAAVGCAQQALAILIERERRQDLLGLVHLADTAHDALMSYAHTYRETTRAAKKAAEPGLRERLVAKWDAIEDEWCRDHYPSRGVGAFVIDRLMPIIEEEVAKRAT